MWRFCDRDPWTQGRRTKQEQIHVCEHFRKIQIYLRTDLLGFTTWELVSGFHGNAHDLHPSPCIFCNMACTLKTTICDYFTYQRTVFVGTEITITSVRTPTSTGSVRNSLIVVVIIKTRVQSSIFVSSWISVDVLWTWGSKGTVGRSQVTVEIRCLILVHVSKRAT